MPNNDAIPMNVVEVLASAELNVNDNSESVAMSVAEGGAGYSRKADKVSGATAGDLAGLDATGNLTDSGKKPADFVAAENFYATQLPMSSTDPTTVAEKATDLLSQIDGKANLIHDTVQNVAIASVPDAAANLPLTALKFKVEPIQSGSGDPSPTNIRPITGRTGAVMSVKGKNLLTGTISGKAPGSTGTINTSTGYQSNIAPIKKGVTYTFMTSGSNVYAFYLTEPEAGSTAYDATRHTDSNTFTAPIDGWVVFRSPDGYETPMIVVGTTLGDYVAPITGTTATVQFGQTVFGAYADWVGGQLVIDHVIEDLGNLNWNYATQYGYFAISIEDMIAYSGGQMPSIICDTYKTTTAKGASDWSTAEDKTIGTRSGISTLIIKDTDYTNKDTFKAAVTGKKVVYPLATPITVPLSNLDEIKTGTKGVLNVWADSGDIVEMEYPCDTKLYVDKKIAETVALILEN